MPPSTHPISIYGAHLHVATTRKQWATLTRRYDALDKKPDAMGLTHLFVDTNDQNTPHVVVWVDVKGCAGDQVAVIEYVTHEAFHAAAQLLDHIGQATDRHDHETVAYLTGWVAGRVWESYREGCE